MLDKQLEQLTADDLERLVSNRVPEGRTLEYKETLPGGTDHDKREFLADISSFANAVGGDLVYGARGSRDESGRATGTADAIVGVDLATGTRRSSAWKTFCAMASRRGFLAFSSYRSERSNADLRWSCAFCEVGRHRTW